MTSLTKTVLATLIVLASGLQPAMAKQNDPSDVAAIHKVIEQFRISIINKDKPAFIGLFFSDKPEEVTWQWVVDDAVLARIRKTKPQALKARHVPTSNYLSFIDGETKPGAQPAEEKFSDVKIDTDGEVASVNFDYTFLAAGKETNWGREMWQLVRTDAGWKIISIIYSVRDPIIK
ncbi:MAG: nuclear transport factor 2 family protein [Proteobacteria bacterium]|nr:nuclear transport factor 2 family protein [Pseudomonadota bacterium]